MKATKVVQEMKKQSRTGMALVVVLGFTAVLLILGSSYLKNFTQGKSISVKQLSQIQMDFFAQGIQRIAMLKFKKFTPQFYRAYRYQLAKDGGVALTNNYSPTPLAKFHGTGVRNVLQNINDPDFMSPLNVSSYSTEFKMSKIDEFNRDVLEIYVWVSPVGDPKVYSYKTSFEASRTAIITGP